MDGDSLLLNRSRCLLPHGWLPFLVCPEKANSCQSAVNIGTIHLLIPAHNEIENLPRLLERWRAIGAQMGRPLFFNFVDDGSSDGTPEYLEKAGADVKVTRQNPCRGPGAAFETGFTGLISNLQDDDVVITLEADNTSDPSIAPIMIERLHDECDLVLAACYAEGGRIEGTTPHRVFLSIAANKLMYLLFRLPKITTFSSFYRAFRPSLLKKIAGDGGIKFYAKGFVCMAEMLLMASVAGARVTEVPMILKGFQRQGVSKMKIVRTMNEYLRFLILRAPLWLARWK